MGGTALEGMAVVAVCGLLGAALLALGYLMYRRRQSESAGDVVAFRFLRPVFRYGLALLSALSLGRLLYAMLWESVFQKGLYADVVPMGVSLALAGIVGYYVASMLLEKSRRVFRGSWPGVLTVCAGAVILCCLVSVDFFGVEAWVPEKDEVASVDVYGGDYMSLAAYQHTITLSAAHRRGADRPGPGPPPDSAGIAYLRVGAGPVLACRRDQGRPGDLVELSDPGLHPHRRQPGQARL